jgi:pyruvate dehydrogenase E1 component alpha subunit
MAKAAKASPAGKDPERQTTRIDGPDYPATYAATPAEMLEFYRQMLLIRRFEEKAGQMYGLGLIGGFCHLYIGQEAVVVGLQSALKKQDSVITSYRDHGHMIACGIDAKAVMAELTGRAGGISRGKGGSMHMFSVEHGFYGGHGIVGAQVSLSPINTRMTVAFAWLILAMVPPIRVRCMKVSTWPSCGTCRSFMSSRTISMPWARA